MPVIRSREWTPPPSFLTRKLMPDEAMPDKSLIRKWGVDTLPPQSACDLHHHDCDEWWIIFEGKALIETGDEKTTVVAGDMVYTPRGESHRITAIETTTLAWIEGPLPTGGRDGHLH